MIGSAHGPPGAQFASNAVRGVAPSDTVSQRRSRDHARLYDRLLTMQAEAQLPADLDVLAGSPEWLAATTVLDLGAGNGVFGRRLAAQFPLKRIVGLEPDAQLHAIGALMPSPPNYLYLLGGFEGLEGFFDVLLARGVLMYLPERRSLARWASEHCAAALIMNNAPETYDVTPKLPRWDDVLSRTDWSHSADNRAVRRDRELVDTPGVFAGAGFTLTGSTTAVTKLWGMHGRALAHHFLRAVAEMVDAAAVTDELLHDLFQWSLRDDACATIGGTWYRFANTRGPWPVDPAGAAAA